MDNRRPNASRRDAAGGTRRPEGRRPEASWRAEGRPGEPGIDPGVSDEILIEQAGGIATVVFNRPAMRNAFTLAMWTAMPEIVDRLSRDPAVRGIVFRGAGEAAFASGADISEFGEVRKDRASSEAYNARYEAAYRAMEACPKPTVAMIHGYCMGGAMAVAMACDLRFAADTGRFGIPAARLGIVYGLHSVKRLVSLVGPAAAKDILFSARVFDAREALALGFVDRVLAVEELAVFTYEYLARAAENAPLSVQGAKLTVEAIVDDGGARQQARIAELQLAAFESEDYREGTRAFLEKRSPRFRGR
jgi:enoyl-CoA hydratase/carnithine racemase